VIAPSPLKWSFLSEGNNKHSWSSYTTSHMPLKLTLKPQRVKALSSWMWRPFPLLKHAEARKHGYHSLLVSTIESYASKNEPFSMQLFQFYS
jgi:hypothetical protein